MENIKESLQGSKLIAKDERGEFSYAVKQWIMGEKFYDLNDADRTPGITYNMTPHITYYKKRMRMKYIITHLMYRDDEGHLLGYFSYHTVDRLQEIKRDLNLRVHPRHWREGIGTKLLEMGFKIWPIDLNEHHYSESGIKFIEAYEKSHNLNHKEL